MSLAQVFTLDRIGVFTLGAGFQNAGKRTEGDAGHCAISPLTSTVPVIWGSTLSSAKAI